jgi:hypothetical protein
MRKTKPLYNMPPCACGHMRGEHGPDDEWSMRCHVEGCGCVDFEADHSAASQSDREGKL